MIVTLPVAMPLATGSLFSVIPHRTAHPIDAVAEAMNPKPFVAPAADEPKLEAMIRQHGPALARLIHRLGGWQKPDCDDLLQDVFVAALRHIDQFEGRSALPTWLTRIAINAVRAERRRRWMSAKHWAAMARHRSAAAPGAAAADAMAEADDDRARLIETMRSLPAKYREVLVLRYLEELDIDAVAAATGQSRNAAAVRLHRAKHLLEAALSKGSRAK